MRLALKFAVSFFIVTILVWGITSFFRVKREIRLFENDIQRDHASMGLDLAAALANIWRLGGEIEARDFIRQANESKGHILIKILAVDSTKALLSDTGKPLEDNLADAKYQSVKHRYADSLGHQWLHTYIDVPNMKENKIVIELVESLEERDLYIRSTIRRTIYYTVLLGLLAGAIAMALGLGFIARPVRSLMAKARRIAEGDLGGRVSLRQRDELRELGIELNAMSDRLADARQRIALESAARQTTLEQLRHADKLTTVGKLASSVAHELGTPLNVIKARARMIVDHEVHGEDVITSSQIIVNQSARMAQIIRELLDFSRRDKPQKEKVDFRLVVNQTLEIIEPLARRSQVSIICKLGVEPVIAVIDPDRIRQVLSNIMINAVEAMPGGGKLMVEIGVDTSAGRTAPNAIETAGFVVKITDTGIGIASEHMSQIFNPFFTTKDRQAGTGLGLSISADIIREHGGWIEVESAAGQGSTFNVYLPAGQEDKKELS